MGNKLHRYFRNLKMARRKVTLPNWPLGPTDKWRSCGSNFDKGQFWGQSFAWGADQISPKKQSALYPCLGIQPIKFWDKVARFLESWNSAILCGVHWKDYIHWCRIQVRSRPTSGNQGSQFTNIFVSSVPIVLISFPVFWWTLCTFLLNTISVGQVFL